MKTITFVCGLMFSFSSFASGNGGQCFSNVEKYVFALLKLSGVEDAKYCEPSSVSCLSTLEIEQQNENGNKIYVAVYETNRGGYGNFFVYRTTVNQFCQISNISFHHNWIQFYGESNVQSSLLHIATKVQRAAATVSKADVDCARDSGAVRHSFCCLFMLT